MTYKITFCVLYVAALAWAVAAWAHDEMPSISSVVYTCDSEGAVCPPTTEEQLDAIRERLDKLEDPQFSFSGKCYSALTQYQVDCK